MIASLPAERLDRRVKEPLWAQLRSDLQRRIDDHEFDDAFPGEHALAEAYQVSRQTVRLALRNLREAGVVSAGRGRTPQVTHTLRQPMGALYSLFSSVEEAGMRQCSVVVTLTETTDPMAAGRLGLAAGDPLVHLERLRLADDEPLALDRVWLPADVARPLLDVDFTHTALYAEMSRLLDRAPVGGREEIEAVTVVDPIAGRLGLTAGAPAFSLWRLGCYHDTPLEWRHTLIRGDRFRLISHFTPGAGYSLRLGPADRPSFPGLS
ncbi:MAG TPA: GntR family transcriptional regulator [Microlunatus sp.]|nr:GntR family transcriptional regulator [Microlunatus sp.]